MKIISRDYNRAPSDDWSLNVQPKLSPRLESVEVFDIDGELIGWKIQFRGE